MRIATVTMVKKLTPSGAACRKCLQVESQLARDGLRGRIHSVLYAGAGGRGDELARAHGVRTAPFFVARDAGGAERVYTSYLRLRRDLTGRPPRRDEADAEALAEL